MSPLITLRDAELTYPGPPPVNALRRSNLEVEAGEYLAIMGPSGSGKSTILNVLGLLDSLTEGTYQLGDIEISAMNDAQKAALRANRIGFVFQSFHLLPQRTALENVMLAGLYQGIPSGRRRTAAHEALDRVRLTHRVAALPGQLSGGERQRVAIARALAANPELLLCDEPTGNLDSETAAVVLDLIDQLHADRLTIVMITHAQEVADRADFILHIRDGELEPRMM